MSLPTLIFIPGAWHTPLCYQKLTHLLQTTYNLTSTSITLPSTTGDPSATFKNDLDAACNAIENETSNGKDVIVIAHSYGGLVGNSCIKNFTRPKLQDSSSSIQTIETARRGYVIGLVLIASGFTFTGHTFMSPFLNIPPPSWKINKQTGFAEIVVPPADLFYHDLPPDEQEFWVSKLTPQSLKSLFEGGEYTYAGWRDLRECWYIGTIEDRGLPVVAQRVNVGMAREMGVLVEHRELQSSHSPFLSQTEEVAGILVDAVEAFSGMTVERRRVEEGKGREVVSPGVRLWQPITWVRFGVPLFLGHVIGRGIVVFGWWRRLWTGFR